MINNHLTPAVRSPDSSAEFRPECGKCWRTGPTTLRYLAAMLAGICLIGGPSVFAAEAWPQFRGPHGNGHGSATRLPETWSEQEHVQWKVPIHGRGWSSPVVADGQVWLTTATSDGRQLFVVRVDLATGRITLDKRLFNVAEPQDIHATNSHASPTPVLGKGRVYVHFGSYGTACLDSRSGNVLWRRRDLPCNHWRGAGSSPILYQDLLIMHFDGYDYQYVVALDKHTGETRWKVNREIDYQTDDGDLKKAFCTPTVITVDGHPQLISPAARAAIAYHPNSGEEIWRIRYPTHSATARPLWAQGMVFINSGFGKAQLYAVRPDGTGDVTDTHVSWIVTQGIGSKPSHIVIDDLLYVVHDRGTALCLEVTSGETVWKERLGGNFSASPVYADGKIYFPSEDGVTTVIQPGRAFRKIAENNLDDGCMASPAIVDSTILLRTTTHLYRLGL